MKIVEDEMMNRWEVENLHLESELMENQEEEEADDLMEEIDLSEAEDRTDLADPHEDAEKYFQYNSDHS